MKTIRKLPTTNPEPFHASIPGSKSYTNRALILAAQRPGITRISNALICDDTLYLAQALNAFGGLEVQQQGRGFRVERHNDELQAPREPLYMGGAGTPARLLLSFAASVAGETVITGNPRLCERPMGHLLDALGRIGIHHHCHESAGCLPVTVSGASPETRHWRIRADVSSQFVSSLLLFAAQQSPGAVTIDTEGELVSRSYLDMTLNMMHACGIEATHDGHGRFSVVPAQPQPEELPIEVDASGMSYLLTAAAITGTRVEIPGIGRNSLQGDLGLVHAYERMGCQVMLYEDRIALTGAPLKGIDIDMENMPDVVLSLAIAATQASTPTHIHNIANLRVKECDRIHAIANELNRLGIDVEEGPDWLIIHPGQPDAGITVQTYDDHRVAMAFSLLGLLYDGLALEDYNCVSKSFPEYWDEMARFCEHHLSEETATVSL